MTFSYNWLQDYIKKTLPKPEKLAELLTMHFFEVEGVKKIGKDWVFDIAVLPNRAADCLSHIGIAREIAVLSNLKYLKYIGSTHVFKEDESKRAKDFIQVEVRNKEDCPRYSAKIIFGIKVKSSAKWIQERLKTCGLQPINNIVDTVNYVMLETGQPLHAFDFDKVEKKIIVRRAKKGEKIKALDDKTYQLDKDILVIADKKIPLAIAGIKGGVSTAIGSGTKNIIIEAANFNSRLIRRASQKLKLKTDASWRFENGIDPNLIDFSQERVCSLLQKFAGGRVAQGLVDFYPKKVLAKKIRLDLNYLERLLGIKISKKEIKNILKKLNFQLVEIGSRIILVEVPTFRLDISLPEDLIEEIGRVYGYQKILAVFPEASLVPPKRNLEIFWETNCKDILKERGFSEVYNYSFIDEKAKEVFGWRDKEIIELENPMSSFHKYLRPSLIPNLLKNVRENLKFFNEIKIFEIGKLFKKERGLEKKMLAGVLVRKNLKDEGFYELKGVIDSLLNKLGISNIWYDSYQPSPEESKFSIWQPKKCAEIKVDGQEIGFLGEICPKIQKDLGISERVFVFDLDFEKLLKLVSEEHEYQPISSYPAAVRDLAILVPQGTRLVEVFNKINAAGGELIRDVDVFDIYSGEGIPEGKENFAFHIIYQAEDRTLSSQEIDKIQKKIIKALEKNPEWQVRQ